MAFCDLNVVRSSKERDKNAIVLRLIELGWSGLAWNFVSSGKLHNSIVPVPQVVIDSRLLLQTNQRRLLSGAAHTPIESTPTSSADQTPTSFQQYSRITVPVDDMVEAQRLTASNPVLAQFDIVAVVPGNIKVFSYCCRTADIDLIAIDFSHRVPYVVDKKILDEAVNRGVSFEIQYSPLVAGQAARKEVLSNTRLLVQYLRGRNIVVCSGGDVCAGLRGPMDAANMGQVLGIKREQALRCCRENTEVLLSHGRCRKLRFSVVEVLPVAGLRELAGRKRPWTDGGADGPDLARAKEGRQELDESSSGSGAEKRSGVESGSSDSESDSDNEEEQQQQLMMMNRRKQAAGGAAKKSGANSVSAASADDDDGFLMFTS